MYTIGSIFRLFYFYFLSFGILFFERAIGTTVWEQKIPNADINTFKVRTTFKDIHCKF